MRRPIAGVIPPGGKVSHKIEPPMEYGETPVLVAPGTGVTYIPPIAGTDPCTFSLENRTGQVVAYTMVVVPVYVVRAAKFPWRQFVTELRRPGGMNRALQGLFRHFAQLPPPDHGK
jgi:hypothetical protein